MNDTIHPQERSPGVARIRAAIWLACGLVLLSPLIAMQFTDEVRWSAADFAVAAVLLLTSCAGMELALRRSAAPLYLFASGLALFAGLLQVWANLAVGIIGEPANPANLAFFAVPLFALVGGLLVQLRPAGLSVVMLATAVLQALAALLLASREPLALGFCAAVAALWLFCAAGFAHAARQR